MIRRNNSPRLCAWAYTKVRVVMRDTKARNVVYGHVGPSVEAGAFLCAFCARKDAIMATATLSRSASSARSVSFPRRSDAPKKNRPIFLPFDRSQAIVAMNSAKRSLEYDRAELV